MNVAALLWAQRIRGLKVIEHDIVYRMAVAASAKDAACYPAIGTLAFQIETTRRHVERAIVSIEKKGFLERKQRSNSTNRYFFNLERFFPIGDGAERGEALLSKVKVFLKDSLDDSSDIKGLKAGYLDIKRKMPRFWIAVESKTHKEFLQEHSKAIGQHFARKADAPKLPNGDYQPIFKILVLPLYVTGEE